MAKAYRALSNIQYGEDVVDEASGQTVNQMTHIPHGAKVEGLPGEVMKNLWDAGVLEEVETAEPVVTRTVTQSPRGDDRTDEQKAADKAKADKEAADKAAAPKPPAAPTGTGGVAPSSTGGQA
jgi:hypothetical protein